MRRRDNSSEKVFFAANAGLTGLAASLDNIYKKVNAEGLGEQTSLDLEEDIRNVSDRFGISSKASVLLAAILESSFKNGCDEEDLSGYIGCSNIEFIGFRAALREMEDRSIVNRRSGRIGYRFIMGREALKAVERGTAYTPLNRTGLSADELFSRFRIVFADFFHDNIDAERLLEELMRLIEDNPQLSFCRMTSEALANPVFNDTEKRFFLTLCHRYVSHGDASVLIERLLSVTEFMEDDLRVRRALAAGATDLQKSGLVTFGGEEGFQDVNSLALSDAVKKTFFTEVTPATEPNEATKDLVPAAAIPARELFYDGKAAEQMERLASLLEPEHFARVQERLSEMGMRKGFAVLFSGGAGCGKTAGAYELARRTGRDVYAVDMSELKSKWVGDSEKIVKGIFTTYRRMCRSCERAPILLFNEADAIFTKRLENPGDSVDQMTNAIQNICLDAIENLEGILIATTNLATNFCDEAFARRFIIKVEFEKPKPQTRARIWRSMVDGLSEEDALTLAARFDFSGGNIENIARKAAVEYVLSGRKAGLGDLMKYSGEENLTASANTRKIGFQ